MKAGRELNALIAEKVMGLKPIPYEDYKCVGYYTGSDDWGKKFEYGVYLKNYPQDIPHYSTSIEAAWQVVEKMKTRKYYTGFRMEDTINTLAAWADDFDSKWYACFNVKAVGGETPAHAICLAALKVVEYQYESA